MVDSSLTVRVELLCFSRRISMNYIYIFCVFLFFWRAISEAVRRRDNHKTIKCSLRRWCESLQHSKSVFLFLGKVSAVLGIELLYFFSVGARRISIDFFCRV